MRISRILSLVFFVGTVSSVLLAADISGRWAGKGEQRPEWVLNFKADGSKVTGTTQGAECFWSRGVSHPYTPFSRLEQQAVRGCLFHGGARIEEWKVVPLNPEREEVAIVRAGGLGAFSGNIDSLRVIPIADVKDLAEARPLRLLVITSGIGGSADGESITRP